MSEDQNLDDREMELFSEFVNMPEDLQGFVLQAGENGFDPEEIERVFNEIRLFVSARIMRSWDVVGDSPKKVNIQVSLDLT